MQIYPESQWTRPRPECPHPQYWTSTDDQSTEIEVTELVAAFVRALQPEYVVETGTCIGQTAEAIGRALAANGHGHLHSLEVDEARIAVARERCVGLPVTIHQIPSLAFVPAAPIDFAWFDSLKDLRVPEFEHMRPHFSRRAVAGFHDTAPHHGPWGREVEQLPDTRAIRLRTPRGVTFVEVDPSF